MNSIKQKGFTIIELLVVIAIIGVLAGIVIVNVGSFRDKAKIAKAKAELSQLQKAVEMYYIANGTYPCPGHYLPGWPEWSDPITCLKTALAPYMSSYPSTDPWGSYYIWHLHFGACGECTSFVSMGPDKTYGGYQPCPPCHCQANGDDIIGIVSTVCQ